MGSANTPEQIVARKDGAYVVGIRDRHVHQDRLEGEEYAREIQRSGNNGHDPACVLVSDCRG